MARAKRSWGGRAWRGVAVAVALVGGLAGCAGIGGSGGGGEGDELDLVRSGEFTFALSGQLQPFSFYDKGKLTGFDVSIGTEVARRLGLKPKPSAGPFNSLLAGLQAGRYDAIVGSMTRTDERAKVADFSANYYESGAFLWVKAGSPTRSIDDLRDATIGVPLGTTFEAEVKKKPGVDKVKTYESDIDALNDVPTGRVDGAIIDKLVGAYMVKNAGLKVQPVGPSLLDNSAAIPVRKKHGKLLDAINKALAAMKSDGTYAKISRQWFGIDVTKAQ